MTEAKIRQALKLLEKAILKSEETEELKNLKLFLEQELVYSKMELLDRKTSQKVFEHYVKFPLTKIAYYGTIDNKQSFTNNHSIYIMNEPFIISPRIKKQSRNIYGIISPKNFDDKDAKDTKDKMIGILTDFKNKLTSSIDVDINKKSIKRVCYTVESETVDLDPYYSTFDANYILQAYKLLGDDIQFKLSLRMPLLACENKMGKCYILGRRPQQTAIKY